MLPVISGLIFPDNRSGSEQIVRVFFSAIAFLALLSSCAKQPTEDQIAKAHAEGLKAGIEQERARVSAINATAEKFSSSEPPAPKAAEEKATDPNDLCFEDYCPCEPDPDNGSTETMLCRNLRNNIPVDNSVLSAAAGMRDARRELREFEADNTDY